MFNLNRIFTRLNVSTREELEDTISTSDMDYISDEDLDSVHDILDDYTHEAIKATSKDAMRLFLKG